MEGVREDSVYVILDGIKEIFYLFFTHQVRNVLDKGGVPYKNIIYMECILGDDYSQDALTVVALHEVTITSTILELP